MNIFGSREKLAIGFGADRVRLLVGRGNGTVKPMFAASRELPADALRLGLRAPSLLDRPAVLAALRELVEAARATGLLRRTPETVALVLPDGVFKMAVAPYEGDPPGKADGARMARWMLRDLVPVDADAIRADWSTAPAPEGETGGVVVSVGGVDELFAEYEALMRELGWTAGRIVPWTFAAAAGRATAEESADDGLDDARDLVLCDADGALGALFEADSVPRLHRAWRKRVPGAAVDIELPALRRYVSDRLETTIRGVWLCGDSDWAQPAQAACAAISVPARVMAPEAALRAAIEG